ncbi:MAG: LytTR family DNA-binding domain-containing protein [Aquabacterium sp.]|nr:LytTR family DNA-binding domain-containing protein [Aquabacterium sp.]
MSDATPAPQPAPLPQQPLRVLIVDDEPLARLRLRGLVDANPLPAAQVVGEAGDAPQALALLARTPCDLVLLDIVMPGGSGLRLADVLRRAAAGPGQGRPPMVVFVTAHAEHALRAFEVDAADYITKPVRRERLQAALLRVAQRLASSAATDAPQVPVLVVSDRGRVLRVPLPELLYLKAELKYVTLCSLHGQWLLDEPLADLAQRLGDGFLRVHRNALVARRAVRALERAPVPVAGQEADEGWVVRLVNGEALAVSRRQLPAVREALAEPG